MSDFRVHTPETAPDNAKATMEATQKKYGFIPNLYGVFAESPAAIGAYSDVAARFASSSLSSQEQQVVLLAASFENRCTYCMAAHTMVGKLSGLDASSLEALRAGRTLDDARLEALRSFTRAVVTKRGWVQEDLPAFLQAGFSREAVLDVLVGVAMKTLSNYTNHLVDTPVDPQFEEVAWTPPQGS